MNKNIAQILLVIVITSLMSSITFLIFDFPLNIIFFFGEFTLIIIISSLFIKRDIFLNYTTNYVLDSKSLVDLFFVVSSSAALLISYTNLTSFVTLPLSLVIVCFLPGWVLLRLSSITLHNILDSSSFNVCFELGSRCINF